MSKSSSIQKSDFENIIQLIEEARNRAFSKVNEELVLLYFTVGKIVSLKVADGIWGDGTVNELANYIGAKVPNLSGFNRRGLYRMKQFYETYSDPQLEVYFAGTQEHVKVSAVPTLLKGARKSKKVSALPTQVTNFENIQARIVSSILTKVVWKYFPKLSLQKKNSFTCYTALKKNGR